VWPPVEGVVGTVSIHRLVIDHVDRTETGRYRAIFGCACGGYTAEETATTQADVLALAANEVRVHEATVAGAPTVDIRF
jgi:hypothetical protein